MPSPIGRYVIHVLGILQVSDISSKPTNFFLVRILYRNIGIRQEHGSLEIKFVLYRLCMVEICAATIQIVKSHGHFNDSVK